MKTAFIVLVCLLVVEVKGELGRCICADRGKVEIIPSTLQKCQHTNISTKSLTLEPPGVAVYLKAPTGTFYPCT
uniref:Chemokine interleukin-8-like domain-containing protein n=1 Tax=Sinocyclocheilus anshuiensis TaxID=1608454 RepID=A0A671NV33_9TELE